MRGDAGLATAETAVALPAIGVLVAGSLALPLVLAADLRATDAAREAARAAARGDDQAAVRAAAAAVDGSARVTLIRAAGLIHVTVSVRVRLPLLPARDVTATAVAADEDAGLEPASGRP